MEIMSGLERTQKTVTTENSAVFSTTIPRIDNISLTIMNGIESFLKLKHKFTELFHRRHLKFLHLKILLIN
jgi:hypothetical protein